MKTQKKQLPNEFTFICDEHSKEQLEKLGVDLNGKVADSFGLKYLVKDNLVLDLDYCGFYTEYKYAENLTPINLADYLEQEQPIITIIDNGGFRLPNNPTKRLEIKTDGNRIPIGQKWQEKTRGGNEYYIYEEFGNFIWGRVQYLDTWVQKMWLKNGTCTYSDVKFDLLPINNELTTLEKELEELRLKEKELLEKIEGLKK